MAKRLSSPFTSRALALLLALAVTAPMAFAAPVPSQPASALGAAADEAAVAAERELLKGRLMDFGLDEEAAADRVDLLSDQEVHAVVQHLDSVQAGGALADEQWDTTTVLLLLILVVVLVS